MRRPRMRAPRPRHIRAGRSPDLRSAPEPVRLVCRDEHRGAGRRGPVDGRREGRRVRVRRDEVPPGCRCAGVPAHLRAGRRSLRADPGALPGGAALSGRRRLGDGLQTVRSDAEEVSSHAVHRPRRCVLGERRREIRRTGGLSDRSRHARRRHGQAPRRLREPVRRSLRQLRKQRALARPHVHERTSSDGTRTSCTSAATAGARMAGAAARRRPTIRWHRVWPASASRAKRSACCSARRPLPSSASSSGTTRSGCSG